jgi:hypothetical protein
MEPPRYRSQVHTFYIKELTRLVSHLNSQAEVVKKVRIK